MFDPNSLLVVLLVSFTLTVIIEMTFAALLKVRSFKDFLNIFLVNLVTNPIVVSVINFFDIKYDLKYETSTLLLVMLGVELVAIIIEALIYSKVLKYKYLNPFILSIILNVLSFFIVYFANGFIYY